MKINNSNKIGGANKKHWLEIEEQWGLIQKTKQRVEIKCKKLVSN